MAKISPQQSPITSFFQPKPPSSPSTRGQAKAQLQEILEISALQKSSANQEEEQKNAAPSIKTYSKKRKLMSPKTEKTLKLTPLPCSPMKLKAPLLSPSDKKPSGGPSLTPMNLEKAFEEVATSTKPRLLTPTTTITPNPTTTATPKKRKRSVLEKQSYLDFGQKDFGGKTCPVCSMFYCPGDAADEEIHHRVHREYLGTWEFGKRKMENCVRVFENGDRVVKFDKSSPAKFREKVRKVHDAIDTKLGCPPSVDPESSFTSYFYVSRGTIVSVAVVKMIEEAFVITDPGCVEGSVDGLESPGRVVSCSSVPVHALLGISRMWTNENWRRLGIATLLLDTVRSNFIFGSTIPKEKCAFSQPTKCGNKLASKYFGKTNYLVFHE